MTLLNCVDPSTQADKAKESSPSLPEGPRTLTADIGDRGGLQSLEPTPSDDDPPRGKSSVYRKASYSRISSRTTLLFRIPSTIGSPSKHCRSRNEPRLTSPQARLNRCPICRFRWYSLSSLHAAFQGGPCPLDEYPMLGRARQVWSRRHHPTRIWFQSNASTRGGLSCQSGVCAGFDPPARR
jgi:hypothetical protein